MPKNDTLLSRFGGYVVFSITDNPDFNPDDKKTWGLKMEYTKLTANQTKELNRKRAVFYMEPYDDFLRKVEFQMYLPDIDFVLVPQEYNGIMIGIE